MKKLIAAILVFTLMFCSGCASKNSVTADDEEINIASNKVKVSIGETNYIIDFDTIFDMDSSQLIRFGNNIGHEFTMRYNGKLKNLFSLKRGTYAGKDFPFKISLRMFNSYCYTQDNDRNDKNLILNITKCDSKKQLLIGRIENVKLSGAGDITIDKVEFNICNTDKSENNAPNSAYSGSVNYGGIKKDNVCSYCNGTGRGTSMCTWCYGSGISSAYESTKGSVLHAFAEKDCPKCGGKGYFCAYCRGTGKG